MLEDLFLSPQPGVCSCPFQEEGTGRRLLLRCTPPTLMGIQIMAALGSLSALGKEKSLCSQEGTPDFRGPTQDIAHSI